MSTRAATDATAGEKPAKRQRTREYATTTITQKSIGDINDDCLLLIFTYLPSEDMNSAAISCERFREIRCDPSLEQTRTGTIVCTERTTVTSIQAAFEVQQWNQVFRGNRKHLKVVGFERMHMLSDSEFERPHHIVLPEVSSLDMSFSPHTMNRTVRANYVMAFVRMLPNLREIDISFMHAERYALLKSICSYCPQLQQITWNGSQTQVVLHGGSFGPSSSQVTELYLDNSRLFSYVKSAARLYSSGDHSIRSLFMYCNNLERLSMKNAAWSILDYHDGSVIETFDVSQKMLIKMVRNHSTLRWLRSDLTEENVAMLQHERPEITFVSE